MEEQQFPEIIFHNKNQNVSNKQMSDLTQTVKQDIRLYSMSPEIFKKRFFSSNTEQQTFISEFQQNMQDQKDQIEKKQKQVEINSSNEYIKTIQSKFQEASDVYLQTIQKIQSYTTNLDEYNMLLQKKDFLVFEDTYGNKNSEVVRFGIMHTELKNIEKKQQINVQQKQQGSQSQKSNKTTENIVLHPVEKFLIVKSINYLNNFQNRTVLVDLFVRDKNHEIQLSQNQLPVIHTTIIYKNNDKKLNDNYEYLIIDPSKSTFSQFITNSFNQMLIRTALNKKVTIFSPQNEVIIYSRPHESTTGPNQDQYRDCIDIGVKLCFDLNQYDSPINIQTISQMPLVQRISNALDSRFFSYGSIPLRIKQITDINLRRKVEARFSEFLGLMHSSFNLFLQKQQSAIQAEDDMLNLLKSNKNNEALYFKMVGIVIQLSEDFNYEKMIFLSTKY